MAIITARSVRIPTKAILEAGLSYCSADMVVSLPEKATQRTFFEIPLNRAATGM
jgi:hypothetical protein